MNAPKALRALQRVSRMSLYPSNHSCQGIRNIHSTLRLAEQYPKADIKTFDKVVNTDGRLVLVDFYADWCGPCHMLSPILDKLTSDPAVKPDSGLPIDLVKVDTDDEDGFRIGQRFNIRNLPTVIAFKDGKPVNHFIGALNEAGVRNFLQKL